MLRTRATRSHTRVRLRVFSRSEDDDEEQFQYICTACKKGINDAEFVCMYQCQRYHEGEYQSLDDPYCEDCHQVAQQEYDDARSECGFGDCPFGCHASHGEEEGESGEEEDEHEEGSDASL